MSTMSTENKEYPQCFKNLQKVQTVSINRFLFLVNNFIFALLISVEISHK